MLYYPLFTGTISDWSNVIRPMGCLQEGLITTQLKTRAVGKYFCLNRNGQRSARQVVNAAEEKLRGSACNSMHTGMAMHKAIGEEDLKHQYDKLCEIRKRSNCEFFDM